MSTPPTAEPDERAHTFAVAGLLHDVGKILEPARVELCDRARGLEHLICPTGDHGRHTHRHVVYTAHVLERVDSALGGLDAEKVFRVACNHHRPSGDAFDQHVLQKADWLASGHDRRPDPGRDHGEPIAGLESVLSRLVGPANAETGDTTRHVPTGPLSFQEQQFLPGEPQQRATYDERCRTLAAELEAAFPRSFRDPVHCVEGIDALLDRFARTVPQSRSRSEQPDVTLYDHSRVVAAFGACLGVEHPDGPCDASRIAGHYRLAAIGLGGIQDFIFRVATPVDGGSGESPEKGMAKRLRARSFYVSLLTHLAARRILEAVGLPMTNLVLDAGGRAVLLLPDTEAVQERVRAAMDWVRSWLADHLLGAVRLDLAMSEPLTDAAFRGEAFTATFRELDRRLGGARFELSDPRLRTDGDWSEDGWVASGRPSLPVDRGGFDDAIRSLGRDLPKAAYLSLDASESPLSELEILGYRVGLHDRRPGNGRTLALTPATSGPEAAVPAFVTANHVPVMGEDVRRLLQRRENREGWEEAGTSPDVDTSRPGEPVVFTDLARLARSEDGGLLGHEMLGALKADVDHLGIILGRGLGERASFGRFAAMARSLDSFFKGFLTERLRERFPYVYTVFGGGDDLFLIGPWYDLVLLTHALRGWFERLSCANRNLTFSAGIVFSHPTQPVRHLGEAAEKALEQAKNPRPGDTSGGRNRLTIGRVTLGWEQLEQALELHRLMRRLSPLHNGRILNPSLAYRLFEYARMGLGLRGSPDDEPPAADLKWRAQMSYDLARNASLPKEGERDAENLRRLHEHLMAIRTTADAAVLYVAAMLTLYQLRGGES